MREVQLHQAQLIQLLVN